MFFLNARFCSKKGDALTDLSLKKASVWLGLSVLMAILLLLAACHIENDPDQPLKAVADRGDGMMDRNAAYLDAAEKLSALQPDTRFAGYRLGAGDTVNIRVYGERDLSGSFVLDANGLADLPLVSEVSLGGLTLGEAHEEIVGRYRQGYLNDPKISLSVERYRPIFVLGEVRRPGRYAFNERLKIIEAVAAAQGFTDEADQEGFEILRDIGEELVQLEGGSYDAVMPGDVIRVNHKSSKKISGEKNTDLTQR